ncbi:MAG TPA: hypothetical protein VJZ70_06010, partial [Limnochordia bacterium]|nr:hypothetical protein [Limnochordia bacterium]
DVLLQRPLELILEEVQAPPETIDLLVHGRGPYEDLGRLVLAYERGQWDAVETCARTLNIDPALVGQAYLGALEWCPKVTEEKPSKLIDKHNP